MKRAVGVLFLLVLLAFGLPVLLKTVESLIIPIIIFTFFIALAMYIIGRKRLW